MCLPSFLFAFACVLTTFFSLQLHHFNTGMVHCVCTVFLVDVVNEDLCKIHPRAKGKWHNNNNTKPRNPQRVYILLQHFVLFHPFHSLAPYSSKGSNENICTYFMRFSIQKWHDTFYSTLSKSSLLFAHLQILAMPITLCTTRLLLSNIIIRAKLSNINWHDEKANVQEKKHEHQKTQVPKRIKNYRAHHNMYQISNANKKHQINQK